MRPIASARANPKIAYEKSCCFNDGLRAQANIKQPKTTPIPTPMMIKNYIIAKWIIYIMRICHVRHKLIIKIMLISQ